MKKIAVLLIGLVLVMVSGCKQEESELYKPDVSVLDLDDTQAIVVDKETGVQYLFVTLGKGCGLSVRLNSDGKPMLVKDLKK